MNKLRPIGLIDMDGTLCDYDAAIIRDLKKISSPNDPEPSTYCFDNNIPNWAQDRIDLIRNQPGWWSNLSTYHLGIHIFYTAKSLGYDIQVLTKGPKSKPQAWAEKVLWVQRNLPDGIPVNVVGRDKCNFYGRFLCDDYVPFLEQWLSNRERGLGILIVNDRNRDYHHPGVIRYDGNNLEEVRKYLVAARDRKDKQHWRELL